MIQFSNHYENTPLQIQCILKISPAKTESFQIKNSDSFPISAQSMFLSRNKKNNVYTCKPQFYCIKVGFKGVKIIYVCFRDVKPITAVFFLFCCC